MSFQISIKQNLEGYFNWSGLGCALQWSLIRLDLSVCIMFYNHYYIFVIVLIFFFYSWLVPYMKKEQINQRSL